jgi:hypothetical protein
MGRISAIHLYRCLHRFTLKDVTHVCHAFEPTASHGVSSTAVHEKNVSCDNTSDSSEGTSSLSTLQSFDSRKRPGDLSTDTLQSPYFSKRYCQDKKRMNGTCQDAICCLCDLIDYVTDKKLKSDHFNYECIKVDIRIEGM